MLVLRCRYRRHSSYHRRQRRIAKHARVRARARKTRPLAAAQCAPGDSRAKVWGRRHAHHRASRSPGEKPALSVAFARSLSRFAHKRRAYFRVARSLTLLLLRERALRRRCRHRRRAPLVASVPRPRLARLCCTSRRSSCRRRVAPHVVGGPKKLFFFFARRARSSTAFFTFQAASGADAKRDARAL